MKANLRKDELKKVTGGFNSSSLFSFLGKAKITYSRNLYSDCKITCLNGCGHGCQSGCISSSVITICE